METNVQSGNFLQVAISSSITYTAFNNLPAKEVIVLNNTGQDIMVRQDNGGVAGPAAYLCKDGTFVICEGIANANQVVVKLASGNTPVIVQGRYNA